MKKQIALLIPLLLLFAGISPAQAQSQADVLDARVEHRFGEFIRFDGQVSQVELLREISVLFQAQGESQTRVALITPQADGVFSYRYDIRQNTPLRAFAQVRFWFRLVLQDGSTRDSEFFSFTYTDNRFTWQTLEAPNLRIHWHEGGLAFGQAALDVARRGLAASQKMLPASPGGVFDVYIYSRPADLQSALASGGQGWVAGHASIGMGLAAVSIAPGMEQRLEMERQIPHELMHLYLYEMTGDRYSTLPYWLAEGLASRAELMRNPDYAQMLEDARSQNRLLPMKDLCASFPPDISARYLAYAQAESFTGYLLETYGISGMDRLIRVYADGVNCDMGMQRALGVSLLQAESGWRTESLGENRLWRAAQSLLPYLCLFGLLILAPLWRIIVSGGKRHARPTQ